jgi:hypothetical protein
VFDEKIPDFNHTSIATVACIDKDLLQYRSLFPVGKVRVQRLSHLSAKNSQREYEWAHADVHPHSDVYL